MPSKTESRGSLATRRRRGNGLIATGVTAGLFAVVLGAFVYAVRGSATATTGVAEERAPQVAQKASRKVPAAKPAIPAVADVRPVPAPAGPIAASETAQPKAFSTRDRVDAHLAAGEFGPAMEAAAAAAPQEKSELTAVIEKARTASTASGIRTRRPGQDAAPQKEQWLAGGASFADFSQLLMLIQDNTSGEWELIDGFGGAMTPYNTGILVDPNGMIALLTQEDRAGRLQTLGLEARKADLSEDMAASSELRLVSLTRLEKEIARRIRQGQPVLETMKHLAGLRQIQYVFVYPEEGEIVLGGPAEGWRYNEQGIPVGVTSGTPTLQLDDFVTALRIFSPGQPNFFQCLIVPRQEGLAKLKAFVDQSNARGPLAAGSVRNWARRLQETLGEQDAVFNGVPATSRIAHAILEADYRMKLIGIGRLDGGPGIPSYFDLLSPKDVKENPPQLDAMRWWLTMKYDAVMHSPDRNVFAIQGSSVRCQSENELVTSEGHRIHTGKADPANQQFAQNFTQHYAELAKRDLVFADLQNIFDLALVAALLRHEKVQERTGWRNGVFGVNGEYRTARYAPPQAVMSVASHRVYGGKDIIVQIAGGVNGDLASVLKDDGVYQEQVRLGHMAERGKAPELPEGRWWWDAASE